MSLVKLAAIFVAASTISQGFNQPFSRSNTLAQALGEAPETFPIPGSLPDGTTLKVDGSTSMRITNEALERRFEEQYGNVDVTLGASRTDQAFKALIEGDIDILSTGRPLTEEEKSQGVIEVPLEQREKLAIVVGPDNAFAGDLTFEQFAGIFRGEITNWSELGGPDLAIRFIDRPDYSDTRRALGTYKVFEGKPFKTGATAAPVANDETDAVVKALGNNGIGYSVVSQVLDREDVRILPMHKTLPDDPRYPYSQYRAFVYKEGAGPGTLAFLGFATTEPGQEVIAAAGVAAGAATGAAAESPDSAAGSGDAPGTADGTSPETADGAATPGATAVPGSATAPDSADAAGTEAPAAAGAAAGKKGKGGFPLWILPLLAIPLLGGLLWWLLKGAKGPAGAAGAGAAVAGVGDGVAAVATPADQSRIVLTPRDCRNAYAYWEIPQERLAEVKRQGGENMVVRIYDVTGRSKNSPLPAPAAEFPCIEANPDLHLPIAVDDRSYCAEIGYLTHDNQWLPMAKSEQVRVPICPKDAAAPVQTPSPQTSDLPDGAALSGGGAALGGAALAGAAALGATKLTGKLTGGQAQKTPIAPARMVLTPRSSEDAYAYWEIPPAKLADAKLQGGKTMVARLYDVTDRPAEAVLPEPTAQIECTEADADTHFPITPERDYVAEVGYQTDDGNWLPLIESNPVRVPATAGAAGAGLGAADIAAGAAIAAGAGAAAVAGMGGAGMGGADRVNASTQSRVVLTPQSPQKAYAQWEVPTTAKSALKAEGGKDYQLRIHDVTGLDINQQAPHSTLIYDLSELDCDRTVPLPNLQSDYLAEVGYQTKSGDWLMITRSTIVQPATVLDNVAPPTSPPPTQTDDNAPELGIAAAVGGLAAATLVGNKSAASDSHGQTVKVHSRNNALMFTEEQLSHIEHSVASKYDLAPAIYTLQIKDGVFNYDGDDAHPGEPFVMLWIHGGTVINQKTSVPVSSTWTTLNGYDDTLTLDVREPATLCAFFVDTYPDDNTGEITLTVTQH